MPATAITDELMNSSFELAYFILGDRAAAIYVAMAAMDKLKAASTVQERRFAYTPTGRSAYPATRTKISLSEIHLLQRLVLVESELFERLLEGHQGPLQQEDLLIRYVKHLVRITTKHNSFYVALGLCRLLYNYTTSETAEIYNLVLQDPVRMRDDHYYRSRKKRLMEELKDRFGDLIRAQRGFRREERFQTQDTSERFKWLVNECLVRFMPWQSDCVLPDELDPKRNVVAPLLFEGGDPDTEHEIELNRMHTLTHPPCLSRLVSALNLDPPDKRLEVPQFFVSTDGPRPSTDRFNPTRLSDGELNAIKRHLTKNAMRREAYVDSELVCLVDYQRIGSFVPASTTDVRFNITEGVDLVELRAVSDEEEYPVAVWPIKYDKSGLPYSCASVLLDGGQSLSLRLEPPKSESDGPPSATLNIAVNTAPAREMAPGSFSAQPWLEKLRQVAAPKLLWPALTLIVFAVLATGLWRYLRTGNQVNPPVAPSGENVSKQISSPPQAPLAIDSPVIDPEHRAERRQVRPPDNSTLPPPQDDPTESTEETRGRRLRPASTALRSVKKVYVGSFGEDPFSRRLREELIATLKSGSPFTVVDNREEANALFMGSTASRDSQSSSIAVELIDASGSVVWSFSSRTTFSDPQDAAAHVLNALMRSLRSTGRRR